MSFRISTTISITEHPLYAAAQQLLAVIDANFPYKDKTEEAVWDAAWSAYSTLMAVIEYQCGNAASVNQLSLLLGSNLRQYAHYTAADAQEWMKIIRRELLSDKWDHWIDSGEKGWACVDVDRKRLIFVSLHTVLAVRKLASLHVDFAIS